MGCRSRRFASREEGLREVALSEARGARKDQPTDPVLLAEIMAMKALVLSLFAAASEGPLSRELVPC